MSFSVSVANDKINITLKSNLSMPVQEPHLLGIMRELSRLRSVVGCDSFTVASVGPHFKLEWTHPDGRTWKQRLNTDTAVDRAAYNSNPNDFFTVAEADACDQLRGYVFQCVRLHQLTEIIATWPQ